MFEDQRVLQWCIDNSITPEQYMFLFLILKRDAGLSPKESMIRQYLDRFGPFSYTRVIEPVIKKGLIDDLNSPGETYPELYVPCAELEEKMNFGTESMGEEVWKAYPHSFVVNGKTDTFRFTARHAGPYGTKEVLMDAYVKKIRNSAKRHRHVMQQLTRYIDLVNRDLLNSMKLGDWIANDMWDVVADVKDPKPSFGRDL